MSALDTRTLRHAFGTFMTGVTVVTAHDDEKSPIGFTANSFTSVSLDPPLLLVCLANTSRNYDLLTRADGFAVNVLSEDQKNVSNSFASPGEDRFACVDWAAGPHGSPIFSGVSAWFDCSMHKTVEAGDHVILIGRVEAFETSTAAGLGYVRGAYVTPAAESEALGRNTSLLVSALIERSGELLLIEDASGGLSLPESKMVGSGATSTLASLIESTGLSAEPGFIYSVFDDENDKFQHISFLCHAAEGEPAHGRFIDLKTMPFEKITTAPVRSMLRRLAGESSLGSYGIYYGDQSVGRIRSFKRGGNQS